MATQSQTARIFIFILVNLILLLALYTIVPNINLNLCLYKMITGKPCFNCGMTRAFLSVLHLDFKSAFSYNRNVVIVFPYTIIIYSYAWYKYILKGEKHE